MSIASSTSWHPVYRQIPDFIDRFKEFLRASSIVVYSYLFDRWKKAKCRLIDHKGEYIEYSRKYIAKATGLSVSTVKRCMKQLAHAKLISETRFGTKQINHIYIEEVPGAKLYTPKKDLEAFYESPKFQNIDGTLIYAGEDAMDAYASEKDEYIAETIHLLLTVRNDRMYDPMRILEVLVIAKNNMEEIRLAIAYMKRAKEPIGNPIGYLKHALLEGYYKDAIQEVEEQPEESGYSNVAKAAKKTKVKKTPFNSTYVHNWNLEELEKKELEFLEALYKSGQDLEPD